MKVPITGGSPTMLASGQSGPFAVGASSVYSFGSGTLMGFPIAGGNPTTLVSGSARSMAVDSTSVYWTTPTSVMKCAIAGCQSDHARLVVTRLPRRYRG